MLSQKYFRQLVENSVDSAWILDYRANILFINGAAEALTGYAKNELLGHSFNKLLPDHIVDKHDGLIQKFLSGASNMNVIGKVRQFKIMGKTGELIDIDLKVCLLNHQDDTPMFGAFMADIRPRLKLHNELEQLAIRDALTETFNRRGFLSHLDLASRMSSRYKTELAIAMLDIDKFKRVNDDHGHDVGDQVLCLLVGRCEKALRGTDILGRVGGDEFAILLPHTSAKQGNLILDRIRRLVTNTPFKCGLIRVNMAVSFGFTLYRHGEPTEKTLSRADTALYISKSQNGNSVNYQD